MTITSWNVNGLRAIVQKDFFDTLGALSSDIICLQETKAQNEEVLKALSPIKDYHIYINSADAKGYSGTVILSGKKPLSVAYKMGIEEHDREGRLICAEYHDFYLVNVYVPNSGKGLVRLNYRKQWDADYLAYLIELNKIKPVIVCGDFNVAHHAIDLKNDKSNYNKTAGYTQTEIDGMDHLIKAGFTDVFRLKHPESIVYTYWSYRFNARAKNVGWRIDYFLTPASVTDRVNDIKIHTDIYGSDHCPLSIELNFSL